MILNVTNFSSWGTSTRGRAVLGRASSGAVSVQPRVAVGLVPLLCAPWGCGRPRLVASPCLAVSSQSPVFLVKVEG